MSAALGVNVAPDGTDDPRAIVAAGATWVALVAKPDLPTRQIVSAYRGVGLRVLLRGDTDTVTGYASPEDCARDFSGRVGDLVQAVSPPTSEFDSAGVTSGGGGEAGMYPHLKAWHDVWRGRNVPIVGPPLVSAQPDAWSDRCNALVDTIGLDLYSAPENMRGTLGAFSARWHKPLWVLEFPWWSREHAAVALSQDTPAFVYCYRSWKNPRAEWLDGLNDLNGYATWRLAEFTTYAHQLAKEVNVPDPAATAVEEWSQAKARIEEQIHLLVENQRRILQGKWSDARMFLDAIDPEMAGKWTNADFPPKA